MPPPSPSQTRVSPASCLAVSIPSKWVSMLGAKTNFSPGKHRHSNTARSKTLTIGSALASVPLRFHFGGEKLLLFLDPSSAKCFQCPFVDFQQMAVNNHSETTKLSLFCYKREEPRVKNQEGCAGFCYCTKRHRIVIRISRDRKGSAS